MSTGTEADPQQCQPCHGTGKLISGLGGTAHEVMCPWCEGSGRRIPGHDAQAHPAEDGPALRAETAGEAGDPA